MLFNVADDEADPERFVKRSGRPRPRRCAAVAVPVGLELELSRMSPEDRAAFREEMGIAGFDRDALLRTLLGRLGADALLHGRRKRSSHLDAAARRHGTGGRGQHPYRPGPRLHSGRSHELRRPDRLGSEREIKAQGLVRQEPKDYVIQDGDILNIRFSV